MEPGNLDQPLDALVVGAGFSGIHTLCKLRKLGFKVKIFEAGSDLGGTWFLNRYPGARVDSETPIYQLYEEKEVWEEFEWRERFPGREELMRYFHFADKKLDLSKDICFNTRVTKAVWDESKHLWCIKTGDTDSTIWARHLITCTGFASKRYTPAFKGLDTFKGQLYHSGVWPEGGVIIQEIGPEVGHLTVYQRTPNFCIAMQQLFLKDVDDGYKKDKKRWQFPSKERYQEIFNQLPRTFGALVIDMDFTTQKYEEATPEQRRELYEFLWNYGGFSYWLATYKEIFFNQKANDEVYAFWAEKQRARVQDERKKDLLAPLKAPHAWGTKRPCLETSYYEVFNQHNVDLINVKESPILEITTEGVRTEKEGVIPVDLIILATGFDSVTGGLIDIDIVNKEGISIKDNWGKGLKTYLGLCCQGFPNLYWFYGPGAPTAFSNGPTSGGVQADWVCDLLVKMRKDGETKVECKIERECAWTKEVRDLWYNSLFPPTDSWYQGANIPGKIREPLNYFGGIPLYMEKLAEAKMNNYQGFNISKIH